MIANGKRKKLYIAGGVGQKVFIGKIVKFVLRKNLS
jgi:hypothetical protein